MLIIHVHAHGCMLFPNQRGALSPRSLFLTNPVDGTDKSEVDYLMHFPSGDKSPGPGSAHRYQIRRAGRAGWVPYNPFDPKFRFRAGLCGDAVNGRQHLKGGKFYDDGRISVEFTQGSIIDVSVGIIAHHNGFMELYLCNAGKCDGDISHKCFLDGHCIQLKRAENWDCDSGQSKKCGPIDPHFPGRWYLPCESSGTPTRTGRHRFLMYGQGNMQYQLPSHVTCEHCVLQWYWTSANNCNPPGLTQYFEGNNRPKNWGSCPGNANARGGYAKNRKTCGGNQVPEEYYQCSDIRIKSNLRMPAPDSASVPTEPPKPRENGAEYIPQSEGRGAIRDVILIKNGRRIQGLMKNPNTKYEAGSKYTIEAFTTDSTNEVDFVVYDLTRKRLVAKETQRRPHGSTKGLYLFGRNEVKRYPNSWNGLSAGHTFSIAISAADDNGADSDTVYLKFM